jgi:phage FluMu protein Com
MRKQIRCVKCRKKFDSEISTFAVVLRMGLYAKCPRCEHFNPIEPTPKEVDLRFGRIAMMPNPCEDLDVKDKKIAKVAKTFSDNMDYVYGLGRLPEMILFQWGYRVQFETMSSHNEYRFPAEERRVAAQVMRTFMPSIDDLLAIIPGGGVEIALLSILRGMVLGTWTAFETFAGDLWEAALNARPDLFANLLGQHDRIHDNAEKRQRRTFDAGHDLTKAKAFAKSTAGLTTSGKHGTHYREKYVKFDSLAKIRAAYSCAFATRYGRIDNALCGAALDTLSQVRNLLVHRSGIADTRYVRISKVIRGCPKVGRGRPLKLRGDMVANLISPVVGASIKLISTVDSEVGR